VYLHLEDLNYQPSYFTNLHIHIVPVKDPQNKYGHDCLIFIKEGLKNFPIVCHQGQWHKLYRDQKTNRPFLGPLQSEVHATDIEAAPAEESTDNKDNSEPKDDNEPQIHNNLRNTLVIIDPTGLGSPYREDREP